VPERKDDLVIVNHSHGNTKNSGHDLLNEYEESLEVLATSLVDGWNMASKFIRRIVKEHQEATRKNRRLAMSHQYQKQMQLRNGSGSGNYAKIAGRANVNVDDEDCLSLSASPTPSLVKSVASISSSSTTSSDFVVEQGIEIIFDPNNQGKCSSSSSSSSSSNGDKDEWKIFFGESKEGDVEKGAVMITNPCEEEVISISSSEHNVSVVEDSFSTTSSFAHVSEVNAGNVDNDNVEDDDDDVSWAMLSDDE